MQPFEGEDCRAPNAHAQTICIHIMSLHTRALEEQFMLMEVITQKL